MNIKALSITTHSCQACKPLGEITGMPILPAYRAGTNTCQVWCCHCKRWHIHGADPGRKPGDDLGPRCPHCYGDSPFWKTDYYLRFMGEPLREFKKVHRNTPWNCKRANNRLYF